MAMFTDVKPDRLSGLPQYVHDHSRAFFEIPIRILVIIVVSLVLRTILHRMIERLVRPVEDGKVPKILSPFRERGSTLLTSAGLLSERRVQRAATIASVLKSFISIIIFTIALLMIVQEAGFDLAPLIAGTSIVGVALGFGAQNVVKDFLSGMFMIFEDQYGVGDVIDFEKASGTVEAVGLRTTRLRDVNGTVWYVRNGEVVRVGNKSQGYAQVVLDVPIDAYADVERASSAMLEVAQQLHDDPEWADIFLNEPEVQGVESMTLDETVIRMVVQVRPLQQWKTARELRGRIREKLDQLHIAASEPQAHVDDANPSNTPAADE